MTVLLWIKRLSVCPVDDRVFNLALRLDKFIDIIIYKPLKH